MTVHTNEPSHSTCQPVDASTPRPGTSFGASASLVNRTHRVVRERAERIQLRRVQERSLWLPVGLCAGFIVMLCTAIWSLLDQYELSPTGIPDASNQMLVVFLWFLPVTAVVLALVLGQRLQADRESVR